MATHAARAGTRRHAPARVLATHCVCACVHGRAGSLSLGASSFLVGPSRQCRDMFAPDRRTASILYLSTLFGSLISVFWLKWQIVSFGLVVLQFCALTWYMLSYVPYGQQCLKRLIARLSK